MSNVLMIVYFMGFYGDTPPVLETSIVSGHQCMAAKAVIAEVTNDTAFVYCISWDGGKL